MVEEKIAKLQEVLKNEEVATAFAEAENPESAIAVLNANGLDVSLEEFEEFVASQPDTSDELDEEALDDVSGGWAKSVIKYGIPLIGNLWKCNQHTNWGRNGKKCICGVHSTVKKGLRL